MPDINHTERDHALLSASSAHRWINCPPSAMAAEAYPRQDTAFSAEGTLAHEVAEAMASGVTREGLAEHLAHLPDADQITEEMIECAEEYRDYIQSLACTDFPLILLEQRVDYSPWAPGGFGTTDCIILQGDTMDVIDFKYGKGVAVSAHGNPQEQYYGLGCLNDYGFAYEIEKVRLHIFQPRMNNTSVAEISVPDLLAWGEANKKAAEQAAQGKGKYSAGAWCKFCPHAGKCRTLTKTCTEFVESHGLRAKVETMPAFEVAEVLTMEPLVSLWIKRVREQALTTMLAGGEIPGYKVVAGRGSRAWTDEQEVVQALRAADVPPTDYLETSLLSVAKMEKALGKKHANELLGGLIQTTTGAPTVAPITDKRPVFNPADDFDKL